MKILVCIAKTPDTTTKISFSDNNTKFNADKVQFIMNPTDEWYALVRGIELKEKLGGTVTVINVGHAQDDAIIRKALAIGADDAVRIDAESTDTYFVAAQIAEYAKDKNFDLIITGKETIDYNGGVMAGMLAEFLDLPYVPFASKLEVEGTEAKIDREIEGGKETVSVQLPLVISANKGLAEARIPNMQGIMKARTKPLIVIAPTAIEPATRIRVYNMPPQEKQVKMISAENAGDLIRLLHEEAKVI